MLTHAGSLAVAPDDAVEELCHVLVPRLDGLERLGEAVGDVVVLGDVDGGDFTLQDAVLEDVDAPKRPHRGPTAWPSPCRWPSRSSTRSQ
eukprot:3967712-Prymnesium_polylepis.1